MLCVKPILCCVISISLFSGLAAQLSSLKNEPTNNIANANFYSGKRWVVKQILKDSLSVKSNSCYGHCNMLTISRFSMIYLSITEVPVVPVQLNVSEKLHLRLQRLLDLSGKDVFPNHMSCWELFSPKKYRRPIVDKFFFSYQ